MVFNYQLLPENFDKNFLVNDLTKLDDGYVIVREGCFLELVNQGKSKVYSIPFWEEKSQYWDLKKIYKFKNKVFILASTLKSNSLKLINLNINDQSLKFSVSKEINDEIINIHSRSVMTAGDVYEISQNGMEKIFFESKFNYYDELKKIKKFANINEVVFFIINGKVFCPFNINKIGSIINDYGRIKVINFDENRVYSFFLGDLLSDLIGNLLVFPIQTGKILVYEIGNNLGVFVLSNLGCFNIKLDLLENSFQANKINMEREFFGLVISSFNTRVIKLNPEYFLFLLYFDKYNLLENTLYFVKHDFSRIIKFSDENNFVKKEKDYVIILNKFTELREVSIDNLNDIQDFVSFNKSFNKSLNLYGYEVDSAIIENHNLYEKEKHSFIGSFINSFNLIDFDILEDIYVFRFSFRILERCGIFEIKIDKNYKKNITMLDLEIYEKISEEKIKQNKQFIDESLVIKMDINDHPNMLMLKEMDKKVYILWKGYNGLVFSVANGFNFEAEIFKIVDYISDDKFIFIIEENTIFFINKSNNKVRLYPFQSKLKRIRKMEEDKYIILDEMNNLIYLKISDGYPEVEKMDSNLEVIQDFIVYYNGILYFDEVDSLVLINDKRLSSKLSCLPLEKISFFEKDKKIYVIIDKEVVFSL